MKQERRIEIANDTLKILQEGFYVNNQGERIDVSPVLETAKLQTALYTPDALSALLAAQQDVHQFATRFEVTNETTLDAMRRMEATGSAHLLILNFASAKNPGGGFLGGALAQEECIARASGLYPCLLMAPEYYNFHRKMSSCLYSDHMIYAPGVPVLKDEEGNLLDQLVTTAIVTSPAVNAGVVRRQEPSKVDQILPVMQERIAKLLALCLHHGHEELVLGAWGCGVFQNNPEEIASLFHEALHGRFEGAFKRIVFAVKTNKEEIIGPFRKWFL